jgi:mRNA-degrading endonuclease RelE of RelBE toxin-antitoxin system|nr:MAG TPA: hypothetical protein [Caudoviricetes sp.]
MQNEALKRAQEKYLKKIKHFHLTYHIDNDADIIAVLEAQKSKNNYIRKLIREDIQRKGASQQ